MGSLSTHLSPSSPAARSRSVTIHAAVAVAVASGGASPSSLPCFRPRSKRRNSLRPKLPKTHTPESHGPPPDPSTAHLLVIEEAVVVEESVQEVEGVDPFLPSVHGWFSKPILDLALRFTLLLAFQTVAAVWLLGGGGGGGGVEEGIDSGSRAEEDGREGLDFERKVMEIQAMAREARASEEKRMLRRNEVNGEAKNGGSDVEVDDRDVASHPRTKNANGRNTGRKLDSAGRNGILGSSRMGGKTPEGFSSYKGRDGHADSGGGGLQQMAHINPVGESAMLHEISECNKPDSETTEKLPGVKTPRIPPLEDLSSVCSLHTTKEGTIGRSESGSPSVSETGKHGDFLDASAVLSFRGSSSEISIQSEIPTSVGNLHTPMEGSVGTLHSGASSVTEMGHHGGSLDDTDSLSFRGSCSGNSMQSGSPANASLIEIGPMELEIQTAQNFTKENRKSSMVSSSSEERYGCGSQMKGVEHKSIPAENKSKKLNFRGKPWWMKLPYVLAIVLRRGSDRNGPKGLYSLKVNSPGDDGKFPSYSVVFQDRVDATHFCYILEFFFKDLGDFSADIVPLTIQELKAVESDVSNIIVVSKGRLRLYAGQPLMEVETALRSFLQ